MRLKKALLPILLVTLSLSSCLKPAVSPQTTSLEILTRVNEFQDTLSDLYTAKAVTPQHVITYEKFVVLATKTLQTLPSGWQATVKAGWAQLLIDVPESQMEPKLLVVAKLIDALVGAL